MGYKSVSKTRPATWLRQKKKRKTNKQKIKNKKQKQK